MSVSVVCGVNWGDEGKGRMVDYLAQDADVVVRYQGGSNAGHTVVNDRGTFKLHLVPSGIFNPGVVNVLGPGMVIDLQALCEELEGLRQGGIDVSNVLVSDRATVCFPFNRDEDGWEEERLGKGAFGSTRRGIAPAYGDRAVKKAVQLGDLRHPARLRHVLERLVAWKALVARGVYGKGGAVTVEKALEWAETWGGRLLPLICDTTPVLEAAARSGKRVLLEAQLGALRDLTYGIYPYTTSSSTLAAFAPVGAGLFGRPVERVVGVVKAFSTCVGAGPFVTEMAEEEAAALRESAGEYGASTGRPRRIGHFDALASRYGAEVQGTTELALTKLDSLTGRDRLLVATHYEVDGQPVHRFPLNAVLESARPVYESMAGWREDVSVCRRFDELPEAARAYVLQIEALVRCPIRWISVGPERHSLIDRANVS